MTLGPGLQFYWFRFNKNSQLAVIDKSLVYYSNATEYNPVKLETALGSERLFKL